jgi:hypothetical protein
MLACMLLAANRSVLALYIASMFFERLDMVQLTGRKLWIKFHFFSLVVLREHFRHSIPV